MMISHVSVLLLPPRFPFSCRALLLAAWRVALRVPPAVRWRSRRPAARACRPPKPPSPWCSASPRSPSPTPSRASRWRRPGTSPRWTRRRWWPRPRPWPTMWPRARATTRLWLALRAAASSPLSWRVPLCRHSTRSPCCRLRWSWLALPTRAGLCTASCCRRRRGRSSRRRCRTSSASRVEVGAPSRSPVALVAGRVLYGCGCFLVARLVRRVSPVGFVLLSSVAGFRVHCVCCAWFFFLFLSHAALHLFVACCARLWARPGALVAAGCRMCSLA